MKRNLKVGLALKNQHSMTLQFSTIQFSGARQASHQHILKKKQISKMQILQDTQFSLGPFSKRKQSLPTHLSIKLFPLEQIHLMQPQISMAQLLKISQISEVLTLKDLPILVKPISKVMQISSVLHLMNLMDL